MGLKPTNAIPSNSPEAAVRAHFGLAQIELARYLGVSAGLVAHFEAGRRLPTPATSRRLNRLACLLPPPDGNGPVTPTFAAMAVPAAPPAGVLAPALPAFGKLVAGPLHTRQRNAAAQAHALRWALHRAGKAEVLQQRRQWALTQLPAARPADTEAAEQAHFDRWFQVLTADVVAAVPSPAAITERALMVVRLLALEAEAAMLAQLLATT